MSRLVVIGTLLSGCLTLLPHVGLAHVAEVPIRSGLGITFGEALDPGRYGAELQDTSAIELVELPDNRTMIIPQIEPGGYFPWRTFAGVVLPKPLRMYPHQAFVMLNQAGEPIRTSVSIKLSGCGEEFQWMQKTLQRKYQVIGEITRTPPSGYDQALRVVFVDKQIDLLCGPRTVIQYLDFAGLKFWAIEQHKLFEAYQRTLAQQEKRRVVLDRRRSARFANSFTMGDQYRLDGAFGIEFRQPFAKNSTQKFPVDIPFYAVLPQLPDGFHVGDIQLVISPEKHPIIIRGTFRELEFDKVKSALRAKYGTPMKSTDRHVIHKVSDKHAILKRMSVDTIELAFIDTLAQTQQRERLWEQESEGL
ncbi:MAG: hypothetical protein AAF541_16415 [Pseudomonadota bacterium]